MEKSVWMKLNILYLLDVGETLFKALSRQYLSEGTKEQLQGGGSGVGPARESGMSGRHHRPVARLPDHLELTTHRFRLLMM